MDVLDRIKQLAERSQEAPVPEVDVRARVRTTLREMATEPPALVDRPSLAFAGFSVAIAALLFTFFLPTVQLLWDPWLAYMNAPWSF